MQPKKQDAEHQDGTEQQHAHRDHERIGIAGRGGWWGAAG
jgi:hypothetical protein